MCLLLFLLLCLLISLLQGHRVVALCNDDTARFIDVGERRLIKAVPRRGLGWCCSLSQGVLVSAADDRLHMYT